MRMIARVVSLTVTLVSMATPGHAEPRLGLAIVDRDYTMDFCRNTAAQGAFQSGGWKDIHVVASQPPLAVTAKKGPLNGMIVCLDTSSVSGSKVVVVVAGDDANMVSVASKQLGAYMQR